VLLACLTFAGAASLIVLLPGPDTMVMLRSLVAGGRRLAITTGLGVLTGLVIWVVAAVAGLAALVRASRDGYDALRVVGACYLMWLGLQAWRSRAVEDAPAASGRVRGTGFLAGLLTDLLNPKVGVFFVSFLPGFVPSGVPVAPATLVFGVIYILLTAVYFVALLTLAEHITGWLAAPRIRRKIDAVTGAVLVAFGVRLVLEG
jgi:threonine/homoserine/homoserine lactone efflux protein